MVMLIRADISGGGGESCSHPAIRGEVSPLRTQGGVQNTVILEKQYGDRKWSANAVRAMKGSTPLVASSRDRLELLIPSSSST